MGRVFVPVPSINEAPHLKNAASCEPFIGLWFDHGGSGRGREKQTESRGKQPCKDRCIWECCFQHVYYR